MEVERDTVDINRRIGLLGVSGMVARDPNKQGWIIRDARVCTVLTGTGTVLVARPVIVPVLYPRGGERR